MSKPIHVTTQTFEQEVLQSPQPVLTDFWADWCAPCRIVGPIVDALAAEYAGRLRVAKIDVDENPDLANQYGIQSIPTLGIFKDGQLVDRIVGAVPKAQLKRHLDAALNGSQAAGPR